MRWENIKSALFGEPKVISDIQPIEPRPLTENKTGWIQDILQVDESWRNADISGTRVVAEGFCGKYGENRCLVLSAPEPENPAFQSRRSEVGGLWIETTDNAVINIQLSHFEGRLTELYVLFVDTKHPKCKLPDTWVERSRQAVSA